MTEAAPAKSRPLRLVLALAGVALVLAAGLTWLNRKALAREALTGWLRSKGVASRVEVQEIGPGRFAARLWVGDPEQPTFRADQVDVRYHLGLGGLNVRSIALRQPELRAAFRNGQLRMGPLDPLVKEFLSRPPRPDATQPRIDVDGGVLVLDTDYGPVRAVADARVEDGRLRSLSATTAPARLRGPGFEVATGAGTVREVTRADRIDLSASLPLATARIGEAGLADGRVVLTLQAPYPDLKTRKGDGAVSARLELAAASAEGTGRRLSDATLTATFAGRAQGWIQDLAVAGRLNAEAAAARVSAPEGKAERLEIALASDALRWTRAGGDKVSGPVVTQAKAGRVTAADLDLEAIVVEARGPVEASPGGVKADLTTALEARGAWRGLGPAVAGDSAEVAAMKRAARDVRLSAPAVRARLDGARLTVALDQPVQAVSASGAVARLSARRAGAPVFGPDGGAFVLAVKGGGLPQVDADVARVTSTGDGAVLDGRVRAAGSFGFLRQGRMDASGRLTLAGGSLSFAADRCVAIGAAELDFGANDITELAGRLCPTGGPVFAMRGGGWRVAGRAEGVRAAAPFVQGLVTDGAGRVLAEGRGADVTARIDVTSARQEDLAPERRFNPFLMDGQVTLSEFIWRADLAFRRPDGAPLGTALITQDGRLGLGVAVIETETLAFSEGGLQPADLSPLADAVGAPAIGSAKFSGRFDWSPEGSASSGVVSIPGLDFRSPAGPVKGLRGQIAFSSLAPLKAAPGQELVVDEVQSMVMLSALRARFELADNLLKVEGGEATVGGGKVRVETLEVPLAPGAPTRGVLIVEGVQLREIVEASPFGDKVDLDAKVSGRIPFEMAGSRIRISGGELKADQPGRLSIDRAALTGVAAGGAPASAAPPGAPDPNETFTDFAYQAMENLAFQTLDLTLASRDDGRLGLLFHIVGRHDPPRKQEIRLTLMDLIQRRFLGRKLPLPSGTGVNLTLDTTLNLDDLVSDWMDFQKARSSGPVQP
ncbi:YdbH domain-containing protein [Phenylobacterium sp.]|uniref:intermembrane phospholipid transport protein YdbH family protein n=1 Tax=Phenylobacterium sp. TaxID=1871053 RepID=UPI00301D0DCD